MTCVLDLVLKECDFVIRPEVTLCSLTGGENASSFSDGTMPVFVFRCFPTVSPFPVFGRHSSCAACSGLSFCFIALLLVTVLNVPTRVCLGLDLKRIFLCTDADELSQNR